MNGVCLVHLACWFRGVMVTTLDLGSSDPSSILGTNIFFHSIQSRAVNKSADNLLYTMFTNLRTVYIFCGIAKETNTCNLKLLNFSF